MDSLVEHVLLLRHLVLDDGTANDSERWDPRSMTTAQAIATAGVFIWLGMVLAISFLEAPLKFRAPGVDLKTGLGIGRLVFRALNTVEAILAVVLAIAMVVGDVPYRVLIPSLCAIAILAFQVIVVRPPLTRRSDRVIAGEQAPRSHAHHVYIGAEVLKVAALVTAGILLLSQSWYVTG
ncbi:hypothetical protein ACVWY6_003409 [Williamsia sp. R60]